MISSSLRLLESLHRKVKELSPKKNISINQFTISALAEKISALLTEEYLEKRAQRASKAKFDKTLSKAPDVEPEEYDKM